ncbi:MAG: hypothetical protein Q8S18_12555 [Bacteroidales bacterium]|nr:hypothetical protein [Bacteroidales bacterium]
MILIRPAYVLIFSSIMLIATALLAFQPHSGSSWRYMGVYTVVGIEKHHPNKALEICEMQDAKLQCRIVNNGDGLKLNMLAGDKIPQERIDLNEIFISHNMIVLHRDRGLKELVGYIADENAPGTGTKVFLKKIR